MKNLTADIVKLVDKTTEKNYNFVLDKKKKQLIIILDVDVDKTIESLDNGYKPNIIWTRSSDVPAYDDIGVDDKEYHIPFDKI